MAVLCSAFFVLVGVNFYEFLPTRLFEQTACMQLKGDVESPIVLRSSLRANVTGVSITTPQTQRLLEYSDSIYMREGWDQSPIVIERYKLIFFTSAKIACTVFKQLFRRMEGFEDWEVEEYDAMLPWNPETNGLKYLYDYDIETANSIMLSDEWTRVIFVREPKWRFLSAYIDKALNNRDYLAQKCCDWDYDTCVAQAKASPNGFLDLMGVCDDAHWAPQAHRMEDKFWKHIDFVGHFESIEQDTKKFLVQIGAWEEFGATGYGPRKDLAIFQKDFARHATDSGSHLNQYITPDVERRLDEFYRDDYAHPILNITKIIIN